MLWVLIRIASGEFRSYGHPLHPDLTTDVLSCVLPLGTVESEVDSVHLSHTLIQFHSACHLISLKLPGMPACRKTLLEVCM